MNPDGKRRHGNVLIRDRRRALHLLAALGCAVAARVSLASDSEVAYEFSVPAAHREMLERQLSVQGREETDAGKGGPLIVIAGMAALAYLADTIFRLAEKAQHLGVVVDTRGKNYRITTDPELPRGSILVIDASGSHFHPAGDLASPDKLLETLVRK